MRGKKGSLVYSYMHSHMGAVRAIREKKKFSYRPFLTTHLPPCTRITTVVCFHFYRPLSSPLFHYKTPGLRHYTLLICRTWNNMLGGIQQHSLVTNNCSIHACINGEHRYHGEFSQNVLFFLSVTIFFHVNSYAIHPHLFLDDFQAYCQDDAVCNSLSLSPTLSLGA